MSQQFDAWREEIVGCLAHVEAFIDFADEEDDVNETVYEVVAERWDGGGVVVGSLAGLLTPVLWLWHPLQNPEACQ